MLLVVGQCFPGLLVTCVGGRVEAVLVYSLPESGVGGATDANQDFAVFVLRREDAYHLIQPFSYTS